MESPGKAERFNDYDAAGNRTSLGFPSGGVVIYTFDALNRLDTVTEGGVQIADYEWDTLSRKDLVRQNNAALITDYGYEADDDLNALSLSTPSALNFTIGRNLASQITGLTASDGAYLSRPAATQSTAYVPNRLNQYSSAGGVAHGYDANGNLTSDGTYTFSYDEENRLRKAIGAGYTADYEYDPLGRRRAKIVNGVTTRFASDGAEEIEERDDSNVVLRRYVYGAGVDERLAMLAPACGTRCFYQVNWQGSTVKLINQANSLAETYRYGPYGERIGWSPLDPDTGNPFRYTGRRFDPETGLYYYRARYYSPKVGRFLQTDPVGYEDGFNLYTYVGNDPENRTDPTGEWCIVGFGKTCDPPPPPPFEIEEVVVTAKKPPPPVAATTVPLPATRPLIPVWVRALPGAAINAVVGFVALACGDSSASPSCKGSNTASAEQKPSDKSRRSKPTNAPPGTRPIDQSGKSHDWIEGTKGDVGAGPADWVGVAPNGDIITTNPDGSAQNHGPSDR